MEGVRRRGRPPHDQGPYSVQASAAHMSSWISWLGSGPVVSFGKEAYRRASCFCQAIEGRVPWFIESPHRVGKS